ncbi:MAG: hypothetical protein L0I79_02225 [Atopostipes sp.]|nr:hypothetical protein [Atopostipes sp.]
MDDDFAGIPAFLTQFKPLIHKTLNRLNIFSNNMDYEDYYQELQIKLIDILKLFQNDSVDLEEKNAKFLAYAGQGLYWHGLDLIRNKEGNSLGTIESNSLEYLVDGQFSSDSVSERSLNIKEFFDLAEKRLSKKDFDFLLQLAEGRQTMEELAKDYGVTRATLYQWKKRIKFRLVDIKDCLTD